MFYYLCRLVNTTFSLLYPSYASYKVLRLPSGSPEQRQGLERWAMFWCVMGCVWVWEEWAEWGVGWFPFYYELKTLFILWLALPQIQGSTYLYIHHLSPLLTAHEHEIDTFLSNLRSSALAASASYAQRGLRALRQAVLGQFLADAAAPEADADEPPVLANPPVANSGATPSAAAGNSLTSFAGGMLRQYGPAALAAGQALLHPMQNSPGRAGAGAQGEGEQRRRRREELERELASLDEGASSSASGVSGYSSGADTDGLRERSRTSSSSSVPSALSPGHGASKDPVAARYLNSLAGSAYEEIGHEDASERPAAGGRRQSGGWFGWGGQASVEEGKKDA
ncbi:hypothetical protein JCM10213_007093 [Rhodosporidiobolus nylandii]